MLKASSSSSAHHPGALQGPRRPASRAHGALLEEFGVEGGEEFDCVFAFFLCPKVD